ncbi:MAG: TrkH family potassium uptake protein [Deinococcota bacterium]|nr:TrkH family potassium uptake protein [Deinococcota bacterium]
MRGRFASFVVGAGLMGLALICAVFGFYATVLGEAAGGFGLAGGLSVALGALLLWAGSLQADPARREAIIGVLLLWLVVPLVGAIPYAVSGGLTPVSAAFESMSGFTATGATVLRDFETFPLSLFMYRALSQWLGGVGIIVLFVAVFPKLAIAGRQLFFAEMPGPTEEKLTPRLRNTAAAVLAVYLVMTVLAALAYIAAGMVPFDAVAHALTTLAAGGFSPRGDSFAAYHSAAIDWIAVLFMTVAGISFTLQYQALMGRPRTLWRDPEFRAYGLILLGASALLFYVLQGLYEPGEALRHAMFQAVSIMTTTGYASADFGAWPAQAQAVLLVLMFVGGSAGSAAGGVKVMRWLIIAKNTAREVNRALHPRAVMPVRVGERTIPEEVLRAVVAFLTLFLGLFTLITLVLIWLEADFLTAISAAIACVGNVGPGLAGVGPMQHFDDLHATSRLVLTFAMYAGRLEVVTLFVVLNRRFWRLPRGSRATFDID